MKKILLLALFVFLTYSSTQLVFAATPVTSYNFQLSAWVDIGLMGPEESPRGYWYPYQAKQPQIPPTNLEISNSKNLLRNTYHINQIYLIYHRQFELEQAKQLFKTWRNVFIQRDSTLAIIPALVLQNYGDNGCNFTNDELSDLATFLKNNVNDKAIAIFEVAPGSGRTYCNQLQLIKNIHGGEIYRLGLQPGEPLVAPFDKAVGDTYGAISAGKTNDLWSISCGFGYPTAKKTLEAWVDERVATSKVAWNFVIVGFNYNQNPPCGVDTADIGDQPVPSGRNWPLAHNAIVSQYPGGGNHPNWAGFSMDLSIVAVHSRLRDSIDNSLYNSFKNGVRYTGYFSTPLDEIATVFALYDSQPNLAIGDLDGDGDVNIDDYNLLVANFGKTGTPGWIPADINKNGRVDIFDYNILVENFGK
jgi:hypothetical protein